MVTVPCMVMFSLQPIWLKKMDYLEETPPYTKVDKSDRKYVKTLASFHFTFILDFFIFHALSLQLNNKRS